MLLHLQSTNYYFDVNTNGFEEALDRQILFFIFLLPVILITALRNVTPECLFCCCCCCSDLLSSLLNL